jgi:hypothetical protein
LRDSKDSALTGVYVIAFIGPAGTGKSQRAQYVAYKRGVDLIIDDGLVVKKGQMLCGKSAKAERNLVSAIRRALFEFPDHRREVRDFLKRTKPDSVLIVATSEGMARTIAKNLTLPEPKEFIRIEDVATPEEINQAREERLRAKRHVIPISHAHVRKNFAGKLVNHIKALLGSPDNLEEERTIVNPPFSFYGQLQIDPSVVEQLAVYFAKRTAQVKKVEEVKAKPEENGVALSIGVVLDKGPSSFLVVGEQLRRRIASAVGYFTGLEIKRVDVLIQRGDKNEA